MKIIIILGITIFGGSMTSLYRFMIALSLLAPSLSFADQMWEHNFTPQASLQLIYQESQEDCPRDITIATNENNEINLEANGGFFAVIKAYGVMDGRSRSIGGFDTSFEMSNGSLLMTYVGARSGWGTRGFSSFKVTMSLTRDKSTGQYSAELKHYSKASLVGFYQLDETISCKFKNTLTP